MPCPVQNCLGAFSVLAVPISRPLDLVGRGVSTAGTGIAPDLGRYATGSEGLDLDEVVAERRAVGQVAESVAGEAVRSA